MRNRVIESLGIAEDYDRICSPYKGLEFIILSNEHGKHYPHVHICVNDSEGKIEGKRLKLKQYYATVNLTCVATLRLNANLLYDMNNLKFEQVFNNDYVTDEYKYLYIKWLYSKNNHQKRFNAEVCIRTYMSQNKIFINKRCYKVNILKNRNITVSNMIHYIYTVFENELGSNYYKVFKINEN